MKENILSGRLKVVCMPWLMSLCLFAAAAAPAGDAGTSGGVDNHTALCAGAIDMALAGRFNEAVEQAATAAAEADKHSTPKRIAELLDEYVKRSRKWEACRHEEYEQTVRRVRRAMLAQDFMDKADDSALKEIEQAREKLSKLAVVINKADNRDLLEQSDQQGVDKLKKKALEALGEACESIEEIKKSFKDKDSEYHRRLRRTMDTAGDRLKSFADLWEGLSAIEAPNVLAEGKLSKAADDLQEALGDVEAMLSSEPWRVALIHARVATEVAEKTRKPRQQQWYRTLVESAVARGEKAIQDARWRDALDAYAALNDLEPDDTDYQQRLKQIRQHVRVLSLYGQNGDEDEDEGGNNGESQPHWRSQVDGVDAKMVKDAISKIDSYYVTSVNYRDVIKSALMSVKVLATTPQAAKTFEGLADDEARDKFLKEIEDMEGHFDKKDRPDHMDLQLALIIILGASEKTVNIPTEVLAVEFAEGMMEELDKFSSMVWPDDVADFEKQISGKFFGVGIQITKEPGKPLRVVTPLLDTPAYDVGIKSGDMIVAVDGRRTEDLSLDRLVRMITGPKGTKVVLRIKRAGMLEPFEVSIVRDEIKIQTVRGWRRKTDGTWSYTIDSVRFAPTGVSEKIGYIRLMQFTKQTPDNVRDVLKNLRLDGVRSAVLDLRFNPGGMLRAAIDVADEFIADGVVVSTRGRQVKSAKYNAGPSGEFQDGHLVVLVDQYSASASEIVSGAVKDHHRGLIIGTRTYGKGSVQNILSVRAKKAYLKLTTAYYYLPSGRLIHRRNGAEQWGVDPDINVDMTPGQLMQWLRIRRETDLLKEVEKQHLDRRLKRQFQADIQLNTAVLLLRLMRLQSELTSKNATDDSSDHQAGGSRRWLVRDKIAA